MASVEATVKRRKPNWTQDECVLLASLVNEKKKVIRGKLGPHLTSRMKKDAWEAVTKLLNASSLTPRTTDEVEKKWHNILTNSKAEISAFRRATAETGGGPPSKPLSALAETVQMVIGESNEILDGVHGGVDSSLLQLASEDNLCAIQLLQEDFSAQMDTISAYTGTHSLSPQLSLSPTQTVTTHRSRMVSKSARPSLSRKSPTLAYSQLSQTTSSNQQIIEELTIKKLKLEIEYFDLKVKAMKRKLEE